MEEDRQFEILLVEDNPSDVELELRALKKFNIGNRIIVAKDGAEALEYLFGDDQSKIKKKRIHPKVIFLDLKLPKISGLEVLKKIRSEETTKLIPVVILTSSNEERDLIESYKLGVNSYVTKPLDFEKFLQVTTELGLYWILMNKLP